MGARRSVEIIGPIGDLGVGAFGRALARAKDEGGEQRGLFCFEPVEGAAVGPRRYILEFIGQKEYSGSRFNLTYTTGATDTDVEVEKGLVNTLETGLAPFAHASANGSQLDVTYENGPESEAPRSQQVEDPWNHWVVDRKELTIAYRIGPRRFDYRQETIFGRTEQVVGEQALDISLDLQQRWGSIFVGLEGSHFLHEFQTNRLEFNSFLSLRLIEGLALQMGLQADLIHDQLHIPKGDAPLEEVLLRHRNLVTTYEYEINVGFSHTFGSIYNNVVNERL